MKIIKKEEKCRNPALDFNMPDTPGCSETIVKDILNNRMAKIGDVRNQNDVKLLRLSWIFDINFPATFTLLKERRYLDTILSSMPGTEEVHIIEEYIESCLNAAAINSSNRLNRS